MDPNLRWRPDLVKGMPIFRLRFALAWEIPKNLFQENPPLFMVAFLCCGWWLIDYQSFPKHINVKPCEYATALLGFRVGDAELSLQMGNQLIFGEGHVPTPTHIFGGA
jgi:hypothetical protein